MHRVCTPLVAVALAAIAVAHATEVVPVGPEFRISRDGDTYNYSNDGYARDPRITRMTSGEFVVVWEAYFAGAYTEGNGLFGRRLTTEGQPAGGEFQIYAEPGFSANYSFRPSVAPDPQGGFVVAWGNFEPPNPISSIWVQRFDPNAEARARRGSRPTRRMRPPIRRSGTRSPPIRRAGSWSCGPTMRTS